MSTVNLKTPCSQCQNNFGRIHKNIRGIGTKANIRYFLYCLQCANTIYAGISLSRLTSRFIISSGVPSPKANPLPFLLEDKKTTKKDWKMMEAYEANKKSVACVVCEKSTAYHPSVSVLYCKCIESLPK